MGDLAGPDLSIKRYERGSTKRKYREDENGSTQKPSGEVTAVVGLPQTASFQYRNPSFQMNRLPPAGGSLAGYDPGQKTSSLSSNIESDNRLLAGYLAHEFLTKGTLFGEQYEPGRVEAAVRLPLAGEPARRGDNGRRSFETEAGPGKGRAKKLDSRSYAEVASLFQSAGTHIPGIVNPTELARWIQL